MWIYKKGKIGDIWTNIYSGVKDERRNRGYMRVNIRVLYIKEKDFGSVNGQYVKIIIKLGRVKYKLERSLGAVV